ncbi:MAG: 16S rRNA (guanine(527)-N(7))-methyltransferase RsmG [Caulobacteraceae bacterium]
MPRDEAAARRAFDPWAALEGRKRVLRAYEAMLVEANGRHNLVGRSSLADFHRRHLLDSAQLLYFAPTAKVWVDIGAGGGLPGLVLAILLAGQPGARVHLIESVGKKCRFLAEVAADLALPVEIHQGRAENLAILADVVTARACAPMPRLLAFAAPCASLGAKGLFLKGAGVDKELLAARRLWDFTAEIWPSLSDERGRVVAIEGMRRAR